MNHNRRQLAGWLAMAVVLAVALAVGASPPRPAPTPSERAQSVDAQLRCPSCEDVSVLDSSAPAALAIKAIVRQKVAQGESDGAIDDFLESRYGEGILLRPPSSGGIGAVWVVPIVVVLGALGGLSVFLWPRRRFSAVTASEQDRLLVERALRDTPGGGGAGREEALSAR